MKSHVLEPCVSRVLTRLTLRQLRCVLLDEERHTFPSGQWKKKQHLAEKLFSEISKQDVSHLESETGTDF